MSYLKNISIIYILTLFSCNNNINNEKEIIEKKINKNTQDNSISLDSLLNKTQEDSIIFLNYPQFISNKLFQEIMGLNVSKTLINKNKKYVAKFKETELTFSIFPDFHNNKLTSLSLTLSKNNLENNFVENFISTLITEKDLQNLISTYDAKYHKHRSEDIQIEQHGKYNFNNYNGSEGEWNLQKRSVLTYKKDNRIVLLYVNKYSVKKNESKNHEILFNIYIEYYTNDTFNYIQKIDSNTENIKKNKEKNNIEKTFKQI
jgi:hypothetical protein